MIKRFDVKNNNQVIYGLLYLPDNFNINENKGYPLVILSHGLSLNHTFMIAYAQKLQKQKIPCYIFDFRGGGYDCLSSGKISDMSIQTEIQDLNWVIDEFLKSDVFDKIYLAGHSQGGLVSSLVANSRQSDIDGLFLFAPAYVICDDIKNRHALRDKNVLRLMPEHLGKTYIEGVKKINLYDDIANFKKPVYIFHGKKDLRVPIRYAYQACEAYENCSLKIFDDEEHRFGDDAKDIVANAIVKVIMNN